MRLSTLTHRRRFSFLIVLMLLFSLSAGLVSAQSAQETGQPSLTGASANNDYTTCTTTNDTLTTCTLKVVTDQFQLDLKNDILPVAQQLNSFINEDTVIWIQAWGGRGGDGKGSGSGQGGAAGFAQTTSTINNYQSAYDSTTMYYWIGADGKSTGNDKDNQNMTYGGLSTMVLLKAFAPYTNDDVLLIAGGGGGGNLKDPLSITDAPNSAGGGTAIATDTTFPFAWGAGGHTGYPPPSDSGSYGGSQQGAGVGGGIGCGGCSGYGMSGFGGRSCIDNESVDLNWLNSGTSTPGLGTDGMGGNGQSDSVTSINLGGCGGGGYGGGQGGVFQNTIQSDGEIVLQGFQFGAGGGGSFAAGITQFDAVAPTSYQSGTSSVQIVFNVQPVDFSFDKPVETPFGLTQDTGSGLVSPTFVDIDNDSDVDAFIGLVSGGIGYQENTGSSTTPAFGSLQSNPFGFSSMTGFAAPTFADIDGDGDFDAFVGDGAVQIGDPGCCVWYFENTGSKSSPSFAQKTTTWFGSNYQGTGGAAPTAADIDADGDFDLFIGDGNAGMAYLENTGTPTSPDFSTPIVQTPFGIYEPDPNSVGSYATAGALTDFDGDEDLDWFMGDENGDIWFQQNIGTPASPAFATQRKDFGGLVNLGSIVRPTFVDLNGDTYQDAIAGTWTGNIWYFENKGPWTATQASPSPVPINEPRIEVSAEDSTGQQIVVRIYGSEEFDASQVNRDIISLDDSNGNNIATQIQNFWGSAVGDLDGDGYLDRTLIFVNNATDMTNAETFDGQQLCVWGITLDGVEFTSCAFVM